MTEPQDDFRFGNGVIELRFATDTGRWISLLDLRDNRSVLHAGDQVAPILLTVNGRTQGNRGFQQMFSLVDAETVGLRWSLDGFESEQRGDGAGRLTVRLREGDWRVDLIYLLRPGVARVERQVRIAVDGDSEALLRSFVLRQPYAELGPASECFFEAPGHAIRPGRQVSSLPSAPFGHLQHGAFCDAPAWRPPLIGIHHPAGGRSLCFWAYTETEPFYPAAERGIEGVLFSHRVYLADRFRRGHSLTWGTEYLQVHQCDWMTALHEFQGFYDEIGIAAPEDIAPWARAINLYELHVGTLSGTSLAPFPTYEPLIDYLPAIRDKGYDAVYIMPHVPYPSYSVIDYFNMDVQQGSEAGFRAFIGRAHELGLKVFMDVTMHGVMDRRARRLMAEVDGNTGSSYPMEPSMPEIHPYLAEHPEWFSRTERGDIAKTYTYAFDHANPSWQEFMVGVFRHYVEEYDVDGFRVDSHTWNFFPNWSPDLEYPASRSFYGSVDLFRRVRRELKAIKPDIVLYAETPGPLFCPSHELLYNYDETWMLVSTLPIAGRRGLLCHGANPAHFTTERSNARHIATWLAQRQLVMPQGAIRVHHLDSHDTYWGPKEFRRDTFGVAAARAIVGFFAFIEGGFMDYHGADEGSEEFYRTVVRLRKTQPALKSGSCDYLAVRPSDDMVLAPLRHFEGQYLLPLINFDNRVVDVVLPIPIDSMHLDADIYEVWDLMTEEMMPSASGTDWRRKDLAKLRVTMAPYGVRLLEFRAA